MFLIVIILVVLAAVAGLMYLLEVWGAVEDPSADTGEDAVRGDNSPDGRPTHTAVETDDDDASWGEPAEHKPASAQGD